MPRFELTQYVISLQKRLFHVDAPDAATAERRVRNGCTKGVGVGQEAVLHKTELNCKEVAPGTTPEGVRPATDHDGCPIWLPA